MVKAFGSPINQKKKERTEFPEGVPCTTKPWGVAWGGGGGNKFFFLFYISK